MNKPVLDVCCGSRMMWFNKKDPRALFLDNRRGTWAIDIGTPGTKGRAPIEVNPDMLADFTRIPFPDSRFYLVVFDPPHVERKECLGIITRKYGVLSGNWKDMLRKGFKECFRVLKPNGVLVFKWSDTDIPVSSVITLSPQKPLFGHTTAKSGKTHWICFLKGQATPEQIFEFHRQG